MFTEAFNRGIYALSDPFGSANHEMKTIRCFNIKTLLYNIASVSLIYGIAMGVFSLIIFSLAFKSFILKAEIASYDQGLIPNCLLVPEGTGYFLLELLFQNFIYER